MRIQVDWKATIALTLILLLLSTGVNFVLLAFSSPVLLVPLLLLGGLIWVSVAKADRAGHKRIHGLLKQQKEIVKSFVDCLFCKEECPHDSRRASDHEISGKKQDQAARSG